MRNPNEVLIVGFGIAGACISYFLNEKKIPFRVVDNKSEFSASYAAAGIINPITGRRYVKTWRADQIIPFAQNFYKAFGTMLGISVISDNTIIRVFSSIREENNWLARVGDPNYEKYMLDHANLGNYEEHVKTEFGYGEVKCWLVNLPKLLMTYASKLDSSKILKREAFDFAKLLVSKNKVVYDGEEYQAIVFCEGFEVRNNPFFNYLPFDPASGDTLIVKIPDVNFNKLLKKKIFIVPLDKKDLYWIGSNYNWDMTKLGAKPETKEILIRTLELLIGSDFEIIEHRIGVRPAVKDRRPLIGSHPIHKKLFLFNGLGTKGSSLAPYWANHFVNYFMGEEQLDSEIDLLRYGGENFKVNN